MVRLFLASLATFFISAPAFAALSAGTYTSLDLYGAPPPLSAQETAYAKFITGARKGGVLTLSIPEPMELVFPSFFKKGLQQKIMPYFEGYLYESLMTPNPIRPSRQYDAHIAKSIEADPEHSTYLINLRDDARFSDGSPVTADDVLYSFKVKMEEISGPPHQAYYKDLWGSPELKVLAKDRVQVKFPGLARGKQRLAIVGFMADIKLVKENRTPAEGVELPYPYLGTGPYALIRADRNRCRLVRRPDYWLKDSKAFNFDEIFLSVYRDKTIEREALKKHSISMVTEVEPRAERELDSGVEAGLYDKTLVPKSADQVTMNVLSMNLDREHMKDVRFRKALVLALNLDASRKILFGGKIAALGTPGEMGSLSPKGLPGENVKALLGIENDVQDALNFPYEEMGYSGAAAIKERRARLTAATKILRDAGYIVDPRSHVLTKNGQPVTLTLLANFQDPFHSLYFFYQTDLARLGIELDIRDMPDTTAFIAELRKNRYDLAKSPMEIPHAFDVLDADVLEQRLHSKFASSQFLNNSSNLKSPAIDKILDQLHSLEADAPEYPVTVDAFLRLISAKMPFLMLGERADVAVFADPKLCFPPIANWLIESAYYCDSK